MPVPHPPPRFSTRSQNYEQSKNAYLAVAQYEPSDSLYYQSQFAAGESYYQIEMIDSGYATFENLASNEKYYRLAGMIRLKLAEALLIQEDYENAIEEYKKISVEFERTDPAAWAYYELGEIYMRKYNDLELAKEMYDSSKTAYRRSDIYPVALERSADISKLDQYRQGVSGEDPDLAAQSQFQLAELFLLQLENPDSAIAEFQIVIDSFPVSEYAAKAYLVKGFILENYQDQPDSAYAAYMKVLENYPSSDVVERAANALHADLDTMEIDYPGKRYRQGEKLLFDEENVDSAITIFQSILDDFPKSKYAAKAGYAKIWAMENYHPPEVWNPDDSTFVPDSTLLLAYQEFADSFPGTPYGDSALVKLGRKVTKKPARTPPKKQQDEEERPRDDQQLIPDQDLPDSFLSDSTRYLIASTEYIDSLVDTLHVVDGKPTIEGEFIYPPQSYYTRFEGYVGFIVRIDFIGKPNEYKIIQSSGNKDIDEAAIEALRVTEFDVGEMDITYVDQLQFYRIRVELPPEIRGRQ